MYTRNGRRVRVPARGHFLGAIFFRTHSSSRAKSPAGPARGALDSFHSFSGASPAPPESEGFHSFFSASRAGDGGTLPLLALPSASGDAGRFHDAGLTRRAKLEVRSRNDVEPCIDASREEAGVTSREERSFGFAFSSRSFSRGRGVILSAARPTRPACFPTPKWPRRSRAS